MSKQDRSLRIDLPAAEATSPQEGRFARSFFPNPYAAGQADDKYGQPGVHESDSSSSSQTYDEKIDVSSPLLPPPGGIAGEYPFRARSRSANRNGAMSQAIASARLAANSLMEGKRWSGGPARRILFIVIAGITVVFLIGHSAQKGGRTLPLPSFSLGSSRTAGSYLSQPWYIPPNPSLGPPDPAHLREIDISSEPLPLDASLEQRLLAWESAPGGRGPGQHPSLIDGTPVEEIELGGFTGWNAETCNKNIEPQLNTHMVQKSAVIWAAMNRTVIHDTRMRLIEYMRDRMRTGETEYKVPAELAHADGGRGIVMVAGNADTMRRVIWSVKYQRDRGTTLPVQVYHFPEERLNDDDPIRDELKNLGVEIVEAQGTTRDQGTAKSYHLKAIAIVQSPWREVLYLDSDSIPAADPEYMFDAPSYKRLGLWATPDYWKTSGNSPIWAILGIRCRNEWEMETGQMFIDKRRHLDVFILVRYMLEHHDYFFWFSDGDKDIFRWAMLALRKRWGVPGRWVGAAGFPSGTASGDFCAHTMLQHDAWGEPLFVHYNLLKQIPSGIGRGYSWGRTKHLPLFNENPPKESQAIDGDLEEIARAERGSGLAVLGDVDCDMLADADDDGHARAPASLEVRRRAARERGVKARYHGGWISALCVDLEYFDPRPDHVREADKGTREAAEEAKREREETRQKLKEKADKEWDEYLKKAEEAGQSVEVRPDGFGGYHEHEVPVWPVRDWDASPVELVHWSDNGRLQGFESQLYDLGFVPSGPGF